MGIYLPLDGGFAVSGAADRPAIGERILDEVAADPRRSVVLNWGSLFGAVRPSVVRPSHDKDTQGSSRRISQATSHLSTAKRTQEVLEFAVPERVHRPDLAQHLPVVRVREEPHQPPRKRAR
jgi:hypothetical protein